MGSGDGSTTDRRLMDTRLSAEQVALRDSAAAVVERLGPKVVHDLGGPERVAKLEAAAAESGWHELRTSTESGTPWASAVEAAIVAEELGVGVADVAFLGPTLATELRRVAGAPDATMLETVALTADLTGLAKADGGGPPAGALAIDSQGSASVLLIASVPGGFQLISTGPGTRSEHGVDLTRPAVRLATDQPLNVVPDQRHVVSENDIVRWTALGLALSCADLVGVMRGAVRLACDYAKVRRQYDATIGSFQAVQHLLADAYVAVEGSRSVALHAAWAADALEADEALAAAAIAKAYCARSARVVCETAIQVHGGIGNTWDCLAHVYLRRALHSSDILGGVGSSLARVREYNGIGDSLGLR
jgi:alkylation response protein AidB-like acyl-CoA dehydrogenase